MLRRELAIVLRARLTWLAAVLSALLVGHGFVLAVDLFSAGSRSVKGNALMAREFDPLLGIVRPTLGGLYLAVSLLGPLVAARGLSIEKERRTFAALLLQNAAPARLVAAKFVAALAGVGLQMIAPLLLLGVWLAAGGHLALAETAVAFLAYVLYVALVTAIAVAAAAFVESLAQAATLAILVIAASWAVDASEGFAALVWLGSALDWSVTTHLYPMERGTLAVGALLWMATLAAGTLVMAWIGVRSLGGSRTRGVLTCGAVALTLAAGTLAHRVRTAYDLTEARRGSLPPAPARALAALIGPLRIEVFLDRDDPRRRQLEVDLLAKLRIARSDLEVVYPLDDRPAPAEAERGPLYGKIIVHVGNERRETYSASRKELTTLIFEAARQSLPDWSQRDYPGYPIVIDGGARTAVLGLAYGGIPLTILLGGWLLTRSRRRQSLPGRDAPSC